MTFSVAGKEGADSSLPVRRSAIPQPDLAQPDRPVWVLAQSYPKFAGSSEPGGADTSSPKTFDFGAAEAGRDDRRGLEAERGAGPATTRCSTAIDAGLERQRQGRDRGRGDARRLLRDRDQPKPPETEVTDSGEVVEIEEAGQVAWPIAPRRGCLLPSLALVALPACGSASDASPSSTRAREPGAASALKQIGNFDDPVYVAGAPGFPKLLFVVEQPGRVVVLRGGHRLGQPFLDISGQVAYGGERGLLSVAFPPDYAQSRRFYVYYTDNAGNIRVDEFKRGERDPGRARARAAA